MSLYAVQLGFTDMDELSAAARQWDLELQQVDQGPFAGEILQFGHDDVHMAEARFGRTLQQVGAPPRGYRTIALPGKSTTSFIWRGHQITGSSLAVFPRNGELDAVSRPDFHVFTCSFSEQLLTQASDSLGIAELDKLCGGTEALRCDPLAISRLRQRVHALCQAARFANGADADAVARQLRGLPASFLQTLAARDGTCAPATTFRRENALQSAQAFVRCNAQVPLSVAEIAAAARVSQRTLQYAFLERFGVTPKEYLQAFRLQSVRRQLQAATPSTSRVADVANAWTFWHMGQFAADYRLAFGELPSETLRRSS